MMKRNLLIPLSLLICFMAVPISSRADASRLLDQAVARLAKMPSVCASYSITSGKESNGGTLTVQGTMFKITSRSMHVWFDGKTQWTYLPADAEISITEPDASEQMQVNPFAIIRSYKGLFRTRELKSDSAASKVVEFIPKNSASGFSKAVLTLEASTLLPERLLITMQSGQVVTIHISSLRAGGKLVPNNFRPAISHLKGVEVVDLRD